jgi:hypothetical protein
MKHPALADLGRLTAAWAELEARRPADDVSEHLPLTVVVPARCGTGLGTGANERRPRRLERDLPHHAGRRGSGAQAIRQDG